jgi:sialate O-acetylesterase
MPIWGWGKPGSTVWVRLKKLDGQSSATETYKTSVDENGNWKLTLNPHQASRPYRLSVIAQLNYIWYDDIVFGDVWLCAGQSNMATKVKDTDSFAEAMEAPINPNVRYFGVTTQGSDILRKEYRWGGWLLDDTTKRSEFPALPYYFAKKLQGELNVPIGFVNASMSSSRIEAWMPPKCFGINDEDVSGSAKEPNFSMLLDAGMYKENPFRLYNAMIYPMHQFPIKGIIWWQGESNTDEHGVGNYTPQFYCLIRQWREAWGDDTLPFLYVQLSNIGAKPTGKTDETDWPKLREAQFEMLHNNLKQVAMVVSFDICHPADVHPRNKKGVAERLVLAARGVAYGEGIVYSGPIFQIADATGHKLRLHFGSIGTGLVAQPENAPLNGFEVAGEDQIFYPAKTELNKYSVMVWSDKVPKPIAVRYAWERSPIGANLFNREGLPASPFRTDNW